jgi:hypothetical protein
MTSETARWVVESGPGYRIEEIGSTPTPAAHKRASQFAITEAGASPVQPSANRAEVGSL